MHNLGAKDLDQAFRIYIAMACIKSCNRYTDFETHKLSGADLDTRPSSKPAVFRSLAATLLFVLIFQTHDSCAAVNYHLVGWLNTFVPGSGEAVLGNPEYGLLQASLEVGSFGWGYSRSKRSTLTLDGTPEDLPKFDRKRARTRADLIIPLASAFTQEFGIKYHFVNTFLAYRSAATASGSKGTEWIDSTSTQDLFTAPFRRDILSNPWVWISLSIVGGYTAFDTYSQLHGGATRLPAFTPASNAIYTASDIAMYPVGSAAPEEMFFRGFLQNEFRTAVPSPFFSVPAQAILFMFAHAPGDGRIPALVSGTYLGTLAHVHEGRLSPGIAVHFWSVAMLGIEDIILVHRGQHTLPPQGFSVQIQY